MEFTGIKEVKVLSCTTKQSEQQQESNQAITPMVKTFKWIKIPLSRGSAESVTSRRSFQF